MNKYGTLPTDLGLIDISPVEMLCWLYLPISLSNSLTVKLPPNLQAFRPILDAVYNDLEIEFARDSYIYITAKTLFVNPENPGNRPGWHSDGFMTDDINYVWSDSNPTVFWKADDVVALPQDHVKSMEVMSNLADNTGEWCVYSNKHLLRLDQQHVHRVGERSSSGMRTFVKVSVSKHLYAHVGNSINHELDYSHPTVKREIDRNCPATGTKLGDI